PEAPAALAHAPAFRCIAALLGRRLQRFLRQARGAVLLGKEPGEALADDLLRRVAVDAFGARIPVDDAPLRVEAIDGVVADPVDHRAHLLFGLPAQFLG